MLNLVNRPQGRFARSLRISNPATAYAACCIATTTIVGAGEGLLILARVAVFDGRPYFDFGDFLFQGFLTWGFLTVLGFVVAAPLVAPATWLAARLRIESAFYYLIVGFLFPALFAYLLVGWPRQTPFNEAITTWMIGPPCGTTWGLCWWYLHRRWITEDSAELKPQRKGEAVPTKGQ